MFSNDSIVRSLNQLQTSLNESTEKLCHRRLQPAIKHYVWTFPHSQTMDQLLTGYYYSLRRALFKQFECQEQQIEEWRRALRMLCTQQIAGLELIEAVWNSQTQLVEICCDDFMHWCLSQRRLTAGDIEMRWHYNYRKLKVTIDHVLFLYTQIIQRYAIRNDC